ncbi:MAG: DEAD/DEAH box helicase [Nitrospirales bacterium]|nr:DEAD/DEAH box helicase [Nitrospira sp.]MDR4502445.1 DEAD/DEAH box helicase [Nitrospirales bacterium]
MDASALSSFHPIIAEWFRSQVGEPSDVQIASWPVIASGQHTLIAAPTGSGKTLAAFLTCIDTLLKQALSCELADQTQIVYVSPLKALSHDVQKNLQEPLAQMTQCALSAGYLVPDLRVEVRTGDTPPSVRQRMLVHSPHILITTPETLYLMLTARKSREILTNVQTVIVDEIHALAPNKRGTHLALSLERLAALCPKPPVRIGLSATQRPLELIADFLVGQGAVGNAVERNLPARSSCQIVDVGQKRELHLTVEVPRDELGAVATNAMWEEIYDRIAELAREHHTTLVFVNTRRLAERIAHHLTERLGEDKVMAHHGSLSRKIRLSAEDRLKTGQLQVMVATASLELGIDIGHVDLVCQIGSPRAIATCMQRIGRAGHWVGATPKGRLFCTTRDDLVECAATVYAIRQGNLDPATVPLESVDILAQQLVAEVAAQERSVDDLYRLCSRAYPYQNLTRDMFENVLQMVAEGYVPGRRRQQAYVFHDRVQQKVRPRRGARLAAITSGGAIPDTATYAVVAEPEGKVVGSVDEDFAVESLAGDIILLGTSSWRIRGIETGRVRVEDAHGAPPNIPFWRGEAPSRTKELSNEVARLRERVSRSLEESSNSVQAKTILQAECGVDEAGADQIVAYVQDGKQVLGAVPTQERIIAERFFDEAGGMQLVIHSPYGGRVNRAWGLALRKRFCLNFDFELQAAATDEGLVLSLGEKHSFPLDAIFSFLNSQTVRDVLIQAVLASPLFITRWRWNISRSLALLRFQKGKKVPLHIQRMRAEDLLGAVFPMATACQDNHVGDVPIPDHPLVQETVRDCLTEAMDIDGLIRLLQRMESGEVQCVAIESPAPSPFAHEILNANPYAFLDDAPLEERRARAVNLRQVLPSDIGGTLGSLDPKAIAAVIEEAWPMVRDADELHEVLHLLVWVPEEMSASWKPYLHELLESKRALIVGIKSEQNDEIPLRRGWVTTEQFSAVQAVFPSVEILAPEQLELLPVVADVPTIEEANAVLHIVQGWMESCGPVTVRELSSALYLPQSAVRQALLHLEGQGQVLRGQYRSEMSSFPFNGDSSIAGFEESHGKLEEWCGRRLLARIHRKTVSSLRKEIEPVSAADFMRFLFRWQHRAPGSQLHGEPGLQEVITQLAGFETAASSWEPSILKERVSNYKPELLDMLCLRGTVAWGRLTPPYKAPNTSPESRKKDENALFQVEARRSVPRRISPTSLAPISFFLREDLAWHLALNRHRLHNANSGLRQILSSVAQDVLQCMESRGASFFTDLTGTTGHLASEVEQALWELVAVGLVTSDGFDNLRALLNPKRRNAYGKERKQRPRHSAGRWDLLLPSRRPPEESFTTDQIHEKWAKQLLIRYGVVFRDVLKRESSAMTWRELLIQFRRLEWRGEIRGGRFVNGFTGEQYALPEAVESLRAVRRDPRSSAQDIHISAADPLNLVGIILPGEKVPANTSKVICFRNGVPVSDDRSVVALG